MIQKAAHLETELAGTYGILAIVRDAETLRTLFETDVVSRRDHKKVLNEARRWAQTHGFRIVRTDLPNREDDINFKIIRKP